MTISLIRENKPMQEISITKKQFFTTLGIVAIAVSPKSMPMIPIGVMGAKAVFAFVAR